MRVLFWAAGSFVLFASAVSCGSSNSGGGPAAFVGSWSCPFVAGGTTFTETIGVTENSDGTVTASYLGDAGFSCSLIYKVNGSTATLEAGQTCSYGNASITGGTASVSGNSLVVTFTTSLGGATFSSTCTKQ
jgi:hypothetical protein